MATPTRAEVVAAAAQLCRTSPDNGVPPAPAALRDDSAVAWHHLWTSPVGRLFDPVVDAPALHRLFVLREQLADVTALAITTDFTTTGSQEQEVINPRWKVVASLEADIRQLEDRFGLTPRARLALGVQLAAAERDGATAAAARARAVTPPTTSSEDPDDDPRVVDA